MASISITPIKLHHTDSDTIRLAVLLFREDINLSFTPS
jgi:hypothetical protein